MLIGTTPITAYRIVRATDSLPGELDAIEVLQDLVARATGYRLPAVCDDSPAADHEIVIGSTNRDTPRVTEARNSLVNDGYAMLLDGGRLYITGSTRRGGVYGLYTFLEDYIGARFYSSTCTVLHENETVDVPADLCRVYSPHFMSRDTYWYDILSPKKVSKVHFPYAVKSNHGAMPDLGGGVSYAGGFVHTLSALAEMPHEIGVQPCLTDEHVYRTVLKNVRKWLDENPTAKIISVSQNDSYAHQMGCQCANCKAIDDREGTPMGSLLTFVNRIADDIREDYPEVYVDTLAYRYTRKAPKTLKPRDNVIIRLCSIECCFCHPLDDPDCPHNVAFRKDIEEWSAICHNLYIWDYTTDFLCYLSPFPNFRVLRGNVKFFKEHHVIGLFEQGNYQSISGEFGELRGYLLAKLLWEPDMSEETYYGLMDEFLRDYYGAGWRFIRTYIDKTSEKTAERHLFIYDTPDRIFPFAENDRAAEIGFCRELLTLWDNALAAAETDEHRAHVAESRVQALYYASYIPEIEGGADRLREMHRAIRESGITSHREGATIPTALDPENLPDLH